MAKRHTSRAGDLESVFLRLEELVLANSGADEFEEVFKLVLAKLWDERHGSPARFTCRSSHTETFRCITELLREVENAWPGILLTVEPSLTPEHLGVCVEALAQHQLSSNDFDILDGFFEFLVSRSAKGAKGQYFTPRHVVEMCVRMLKPSETESVVDPACGSGGFLIHTLNYLRRTHEWKEQELKEYCSSKLWGFDLDGRAVRVAKALMVIAGDGSANIIRLNSLLKPEMAGLFSMPLSEKEETRTSLTIEDVCRSRIRKHKGFDVILTNPPFAGEVRERNILDGYELAREKPRIERDVLFLERCLDLLKPGGRLAIVLPHNKFAADSCTYMRKWLVSQAKVFAVVGLGRNTFLPHTHQKASVLFAQKRLGPNGTKKSERIFFAVSEKDGKNSKGQMVERSGVNSASGSWSRIDHDFEEIVERFDDFKKSESLGFGE